MSERMEPKQPELPPLPCGKPHNSKYWDAGIEWNVAGERAVRMEREDQLLDAQRQLAEKVEQIAGLQDAVLGLERQLSEAKARIAELEKDVSFIGTHKDMGDCPTFYDGCHCTHETLAHNIQRAEAAEAKLKECERQRDHTWTQRNADLFAERNALAAKLKAVEGIMREKIESYADYGTKIYLKPNVDALLARIREAIQ